MEPENLNKKMRLRQTSIKTMCFSSHQLQESEKSVAPTNLPVQKEKRKSCAEKKKESSTNCKLNEIYNNIIDIPTIRFTFFNEKS